VHKNGPVDRASLKIDICMVGYGHKWFVSIFLVIGSVKLEKKNKKQKNLS
jgi:hypothetical protein